MCIEQKQGKFMGAQEIDVGDRDMRDLIKELVEARNKKIYKA